MSLQNTPVAQRFQIGIFGNVNSGKSSLINALVKQTIAIVANSEGTTTDPIFKAIEIEGIGPCTIIDTAGYNDTSDLGILRINRTNEIIMRCDITILVVKDILSEQEIDLYNKLNKNAKCIIVYNNFNDKDMVDTNIITIKKQTTKQPILIDAKNNININLLIEEIAKNIPTDYDINTIFNNVESNDVIMLVMPQDKAAPKGRLILPQVQSIRELLDTKAIIICTTLDTYKEALSVLKNNPKMIVCDSSIFKEVYADKPKDSILTSFSILFAGYKGDINYFIESTKVLDNLKQDAKLLIVEACTHTTINEDIGRIKIPKLLRQKYGNNITIDFSNGINFPSNIKQYDLVIHCGACMFNRTYVMNRINLCKESNVPMCNYGVLLAYLNNILKDIAL